MKTGFDAVQRAIEEGKSRGDFTPGHSLGYLSWKDKEVHVVRFLTDDVITADMHEFIQTNDGKTKNFLIDPDKGDFVARYASPTPGLGWTTDYKTKQTVPSKPRTRTIGVAVVREMVQKPGGGFDIVDKVDSLEIGGQSFQKRNFVLITQSASNFWNSLMGSYMVYGTLTDRDYRIQRIGSGVDTSYSITPLDPVEELRDPEVLRDFYGYGKPVDENDPDRFLFCPQTLAEWAEYRSSEEWAQRWLTPSGETPSQAFTTTTATAAAPAVQGFVKTGANEAQASVAAEPSGQTDFASLRNKLLANKGK